MSKELIGLHTLLELKGGVVARAVDAGLGAMARDIAAAPDVEDWRELKLVIRSKPNVKLGGTVTEVAIKPVKLSERVTSFVGDVKQDSGRNHRLVADREALGLGDEVEEEAET